MTEPITIVMIEDDDGHARLIEKNIRRAGVMNDMRRFADGTSAVRWLLNECEHCALLVLLDLNLPDMSGVDILRRVKSHPTLKAAPVVVLATTDDKTEINRCYELGCSVYVTKPIDYDSFAEAIRRLGLFLQVVRAPELQG
ncbi:MAG: response regulator, partial [Pseudomonadota bacterium]|nr:response regulator [Pseudomonadota bacterium]